jgi:hypothetical protein
LRDDYSAAVCDWRGARSLLVIVGRSAESSVEKVVVRLPQVVSEETTTSGPRNNLTERYGQRRRKPGRYQVGLRQTVCATLASNEHEARADCLADRSRSCAGSRFQH